MADQRTLSAKEQREAIDQLRAFLDAKIEPIVVEYRDRFIPKERMLSIAQQLVEFGLIVAPFPEDAGGWGLPWETHMRLFEEVCYTSSDIGLAISINAIGGNLLHKRAPEHIAKQYLPMVLKGEALLSVCISEPGVGSDVSSVSVRAKKDGDHYVINGEKTWITNGDYSDFLVVTARTGDGDTGGLTHIFVDRKEHGYETRSIAKIALNSQSTAQVFFNDTRVPIANRVGDEGKALSQTLQIFEVARLIMAFWAIGLARRALDEAIRYATERRQHGKVIAGHQLIAAQLAEMATEIHAARGLALDAVRLIQAGVRADKEVSMAKWYACEMVGDRDPQGRAHPRRQRRHEGFPGREARARGDGASDPGRNHGSAKAADRAAPHWRECLQIGINEQHNMKIEGKTAVVTGAASGMGRGTCEAFVAAGANVLAMDMDEAGLAALCEQLGERAAYAVADVTSAESVETAVKTAVERFGTIHICVNCAGMPAASKTIGRDGLPQSLEVFRRVVDVNLIGTFNVLRLCAAEMIKNQPEAGERGVIINTSSGAAQDGQAGQAAYSASKAGVEALALPIARDLSAHGIRVNTISPGLFETKMVGNLPEKVRIALIDMVLSPKRMGQPADYALLAKHLVENGYMNTSLVRLDAGIRLAQK